MGPLVSAARVRPPSQNNRTETAVVAATASSSIATSALSPDHWFSCICESAFNINFSDTGADTVTNPSAEYLFAANTIYSFELNQTNTHFKVTAESTGVFLHWRSSRS